jgi:Phage protein (N4 Gp49/phage Sf6 gene 66) family
LALTLAGAEAVMPATPSTIGPLMLLKFCVLVLRNGFTVTGESACASPENFDAQIGRRLARANAVNKVWPLMGYQLREQLHQQGGQQP